MVKQKVKIVGPFKLDTEGAEKIIKSFGLTMASAGVVVLGDLFGVVDFGQYQNIAIIFVPFILNALRKWIGTQTTQTTK